MDQNISKLSDIEKDLLQQACDCALAGHVSYKALTKKTGRKKHNLNEHLKNIYNKLRVKDLASAIVNGIKFDLIEFP